MYNKMAASDPYCHVVSSPRLQRKEGRGVGPRGTVNQASQASQVSVF